MVRLGEGGLEQPLMAAPKLGFPEKFFPVASALRACKMPVPLLCSCHQHQPQFPSPAPWQVNTYWRCHRLKMQIQHLRHLGIKITHVTYSFLLFINHPIPLMDTCSHKAFWTEFTPFTLKFTFQIQYFWEFSRFHQGCMANVTWSVLHGGGWSKMRTISPPRYAVGFAPSSTM